MSECNTQDQMHMHACIKPHVNYDNYYATKQYILVTCKQKTESSKNLCVIYPNQLKGQERI